MSTTQNNMRKIVGKRIEKLSSTKKIWESGKEIFSSRFSFFFFSHKMNDCLKKNEEMNKIIFISTSK